MPILKWVLEEYAQEPYEDDNYFIKLPDGNIKLFFFWLEEMQCAWFSVDEANGVMTIYSALTTSFKGRFSSDAFTLGTGAS